MSCTECESLNKLLAPLGFAVFVATVLPSLEYLILILLTITVISSHIHYGVEVVSINILYILLILNITHRKLISNLFFILL